MSLLMLAICWGLPLLHGWWLAGNWLLKVGLDSGPTISAAYYVMQERNGTWVSLNADGPYRAYRNGPGWSEWTIR